MKSSRRLWIGASLGAALAVAAAGFLLGVQPSLASAATDEQARAAVVAQQHTTEMRLTELSSEAARQGELDTKQAGLLKAVPSSLSANTFIGRINELAGLNGVVVEAITPGPGVAYAPPASSTASPATAGTATVLGKTDPLITAKNFVVIPMAVTVKGSREAVLSFTRDAQSDQRLFLVSNYVLAPVGEDSTDASATLTGSVYAVKR